MKATTHIIGWKLAGKEYRLAFSPVAAVGNRNRHGFSWQRSKAPDRPTRLASARDQILGACSRRSNSKSKPTHRFASADDLSGISVGAGIPRQRRRCREAACFPP
jgi:hypothetical protein